MEVHPDYSQHKLFAQAESFIAEDDYLQALVCYEELMDQTHGRPDSERFDFFSGPYLELIYKTGNYANMLADCSYYLRANALVNGLLSRAVVRGDAKIVEWLEKLEKECLDNVLFTRNSTKVIDALICCADEDVENVQRPLTEALHKLGVHVKPDPYTVPANQWEISFKEFPLVSDALIVILSRSFFATSWPQEDLYEILNKAGANSMRVIPIWHSITRPEVLAASENLEKILAFDTTTKSISEIAQGMADILRPDLASGALHKNIWASMRQGKVIGGAVTDFPLPVRHHELDEGLVARIRLIRAAFLDGNRQSMRAWTEAFSCEFEPHSAVGEWEHLAYVFQEILIAQRHTRILIDQGKVFKKAEENWIAGFVTKNISLFADLTSRSIYEEEDIQNEVINYFVELAGYSSDLIFNFVWISSQPLIWGIYDDNDRRIIEYTAAIFFNSLEPIIEPVDDWIEDITARNKMHAVDSSFNPVIESWDPLAEGIVDGKNVREGILHTDDERPWSKEWDVFISHASEDKGELVRPLAEALKEYGVKVWYDSFTLQPGLGLGESIFTGIEAAEFGIIVLSPHFIRKEWPRKEYEVLQKQQAELGDRLITLWFKLAPEERPEWIGDIDLAKSLDAADQSLTALTMLVLKRIRPDLASFNENRLKYINKVDAVNKGKASTKSINFQDIKVDAGPRKFEMLPKGLVDRVRLIRAVLYDSDPHSMEYWLDGFLRDYNPELQIEYWEKLASMYQEAIMLVDILEKSAKKSLRRFITPKQPTIEHEDLYGMILLLTNFPEEHESVFRQKYPDKIVNAMLRIVRSPTVIDILDPD